MATSDGWSNAPPIFSFHSRMKRENGPCTVQKRKARGRGYGGAQGVPPVSGISSARGVVRAGVCPVKNRLSSSFCCRTADRALELLLPLSLKRAPLANGGAQGVLPVSGMSSARGVVRAGVCPVKNRLSSSFCCRTADRALELLLPLSLKRAPLVKRGQRERERLPPLPFPGTIYAWSLAQPWWLKRYRITANCARVAVPSGFRRPSLVPVTMPLPTAHARASCA